MRKIARSTDGDNQDRWLLTYADMITLLMAFFIMMYSLSVLNLTKFRDAAISIRSGFNGQKKGRQPAMLGAGPSRQRESVVSGPVRDVLAPLMDYVEADEQLRDQVSVAEDARGIVITMLSDKTLFEAGKATLSSESYPLLDRLAESLTNVTNRIQVEGHTCNLQPRGSRYPSNWELSAARATTVLRYLVEAKGLDPRQFSAAGYGSVRPGLPNTDEDNRRRNRRVEIVILRPGQAGDDAGPSDQSGDNRSQIRRSSQ